MRLLVHSLWQCNHDNCHGYPLKIEICEGKDLEERRAKRENPELESVQVIPQEFDAKLVISMLEKIVDYDTLANTAAELSITIPQQRPNETDDQALRQLHYALFECHIMEALLRCPACGHQYVVSNGIPDFVQN